MDNQITKIAQRIKGLRGILELTVSEMAQVCGISEQDYVRHENGEVDFNFTFLYKCAGRFGVDITELITGDRPTLSKYCLVRKGEGMPIERRAGFSYQHMNYLFRDKSAESFVVSAHCEPDAETKPVAQSTHTGEELDLVLRGTLKVCIENHTEILNEGDCIYYNSMYPHGMVALNGDCEFLAVVVNTKNNKTGDAS